LWSNKKGDKHLTISTPIATWTNSIFVSGGGQGGQAAHVGGKKEDERISTTGHENTGFL